MQKDSVFTHLSALADRQKDTTSPCPLSSPTTASPWLEEQRECGLRARHVIRDSRQGGGGKRGVPGLRFRQARWLGQGIGAFWAGSPGRGKALPDETAGEPWDSAGGRPGPGRREAGRTQKKRGRWRVGPRGRPRRHPRKTRAERHLRLTAYAVRLTCLPNLIRAAYKIRFKVHSPWTAR